MNTKTLIAALDAAPGMIIELIREMPGEELKRRPAPDKWSVHEHACHISIGHDVFLARLDRILSNSHPRIEPMETALGEKVDSPDDLDLDEVLSVYVRDRAEVIERLETLSEADWQRTAEHEAFRSYSVYLMFRDLHLHEMYHGYRIQELVLQTEWK